MSKAIFILSFPCLLFFMACSFPFLSEASSSPKVEETSGETPEDQQLMLSLVNDLRKKGCRCGSTYMPPTSPLVLNKKLNEAASIHAEDMYANQFFRHRGSDGSRVGDRARRVGYQWTAIGENISGGYPSARAAFTGWLKSPGHCENMMSDYYRDMGLSKKGAYWVQTFGSSNN